MPDIETLKLQRILVVSPRGLGDARWRDIGSKLREHPIGLPVERVAGLDKNRVDISKSKFKALIGDDRDFSAKWRARRGRRGDAQDIAEYDDCFKLGEVARARMSEGRTGIQLGALCCAISHILAWRRVAELNETCLVLEDDVALLPQAEAEMPCPDDAALMVGWSGFVYHYVETEVGGRMFKRLLRGLPEASETPALLNGGLQAYALKPDSARRLLEELLPMDHSVQVDTMVFGVWDPGDFQIYACEEDWAENRSSLFENPSMIGHAPSPIKSLLSALAYSRLRLLLRPAAWIWNALRDVRR